MKFREELVVWRWVGVALLAASAAGCTARPEPFVNNDDVPELPERHQEQLNNYLQKYFGTSLHPRFMKPDLEAMESAESGEVPLVDRIERIHLLHGRNVYNERCAPCHGVTGDGMGPAAEYLVPKPRDYRKGLFKFTSTPRSAKPRRADLARTIRRGAKGNSMPAFPWLPDEDLEAVIDYVIMLSQRGEMELNLIRESQFELEEEDDYDPRIVADFAERIAGSWEQAADQLVLPVTRNPRRTDETIALGRKIFQSEACAKCHGEDGRGGRRPGVSAEDVPKDDWGQVAYAADLTSGMLRGGRRPIDIYRRIYSGINGTPMPAFSQAYQEDPDTIWHLVHFVIDVVERGTVEPPSEAAEERVEAAAAAAAE